MDCFLLDEVWEDGMLGQRGHFFTLELKASKKTIVPYINKATSEQLGEILESA
jgi:hypothetical protein